MRKDLWINSTLDIASLQEACEKKNLPKALDIFEKYLDIKDLFKNFDANKMKILNDIVNLWKDIFSSNIENCLLKNLIKNINVHLDQLQNINILKKFEYPQSPDDEGYFDEIYKHVDSITYLREDWAVIICLVGGGQEINTGEAGISEWLRAINSSFSNWNVFISDKLRDKEYATGEIDKLLENNSHVRKKSDLHLAVSMRSFRAEQLSEFVHALLASNVDEAKRLYESLKERYPIVLTRSLDKAKAWLKQQKRGSERYGMLVSSQAQRLRPLSIDVRCKPDTVHWFLDDIDDIRSSLFLEDAASEFDVQGLELDWTCIVWDGDLRHEKNSWGNYSFTGNKWQNIRSEERKSYQINAYRVLLTRARQGMIICVPEGNPEDGTRNPDYYDGTFDYLKSIGLEEI